MKEIPLTMNRVALVDDDDFERVNQFKWTASTKKGRKREIWYARRGVRNGKEKQMTIRMHRFILNAPANLDVDHRNGNGLDNRKENLRIATKSQNRCNTMVMRNKFGFRGVSKISRSNAAKPYTAYIYFEHQRFYLGYFDTAEAAARSYDKKAKELHGEFATLNFQ